LSRQQSQKDKLHLGCAVLLILAATMSANDGVKSDLIYLHDALKKAAQVLNSQFYRSYATSRSTIIISGSAST
jgi:hypothetical protein